MSPPQLPGSLANPRRAPGSVMRRPRPCASLVGVFAALVSVTAASLAWAVPEDDLTRQAAMAQRFAPFDEGAGPNWGPAFDFPFFRSAGVGDSDAVSLLLKPGAYQVVVLCNCEKLAVTLRAPDGSAPPPARVNDQGAMFSLDVPIGGEFVVTAEMQDCQEDACSYAVKAYRKKS